MKLEYFMSLKVVSQISVLIMYFYSIQNNWLIFVSGMGSRENGQIF